MSGLSLILHFSVTSKDYIQFLVTSISGTSRVLRFLLPLLYSFIIIIIFFIIIIIISLSLLLFCVEIIWFSVSSLAELETVGLTYVLMTCYLVYL